MKNRVLSMDGQAVEHVKTLPGWHKKRSDGRMCGEACSTVAKRDSKKIVECASALELGVVRKFRVPSTYNISWLKGMRWRGVHTDGSTMLGDMVEKRNKRLVYIRPREWQDRETIDEMLGCSL